MIKKTRSCIVCGKEYEYCNNCKKHANSPSWMAIYHDENCRNIMNIATDYMAGDLTKAEAKLQLDGCNLSNKKNFKESVVKAIDEIYTEKKSAKSDIVKNAKENAEDVK